MAKPSPRRRSLAEFVAQDRPQHTGVCWVRTIPEREEINEARDRNAPVSSVVRWLRTDCGYPPSVATEPRLRRHMKGECRCAR